MQREMLSTITAQCKYFALRKNMVTTPSAKVSALSPAVKGDTTSGSINSFSGTTVPSIQILLTARHNSTATSATLRYQNDVLPKFLSMMPFPFLTLSIAKETAIITHKKPALTAGFSFCSLFSSIY